jgi:hypothetical protein
VESASRALAQNLHGARTHDLNPSVHILAAFLAGVVRNVGTMQEHRSDDCVNPGQGKQTAAAEDVRALPPFRAKEGSSHLRQKSLGQIFWEATDETDHGTILLHHTAVAAR